jgi:hypothetical protein
MKCCLKCAGLCLITHLVIQITVKEGNGRVKGSERRCGWGVVSPSARRTACRVLVEKIEPNTAWRTGCILNYNIKVNFKERQWEGVDCACLRIGTSRRLL